jgi:hypothetical protein
MRTLDVVGWTCFIHSCTWSWLITSSWKDMSASCQCYGWSSPFFAIIVDGLPQIVHSWNFIFLFNWLSQYCGDIFQLCLPTLLIETHCRWFLYQFVSLVFPINLYTSHVWWTVAT